jgi:hypothetical protein
MSKQILVLISSVSAQTYSLVGGAVQYFYPNATGSMDCAIHIKNESLSVLKLKYKKVSIDYPAKWDVSFCDNVNCSNSFGDSGTMSDIPVGDEESSLKISTFPNGFADTAIVKYEMWDENAPSKIDTMVFNIYVRWGVGLNSLSNYTTIFPNPSINTFNIQSNVAISGIESVSLLDLERRCRSLGIKLRIIPTAHEIVSGAVRLSDIEDISEEDLLGRRPVSSDESKISEFIRGKRVLITGAGGGLGECLRCQWLDGQWHDL